jgi:hypothetical protein
MNNKDREREKVKKGKDIYKTLYLTWWHHALGVILCLCHNFFELSTAELFLQSQRILKKLGFNIFVYEGQYPWHTW